MNATVQPAANITATDRLGLTLFFSVVLHGIVILGIVFTHNSPPKNDAPPTLEVILSQTEDPNKIKDADYLAQANAKGSGNVKKRIRPTQTRAAPTATPAPGQSETMQLPSQATPPQTTQNVEVLTAEQADHRVTAPTQEQTHPQEQIPSAAELMMRSKEIARLSAEIHDSIRAYTRRPRERYISARTKSYRDAAYLESWRDKIERIGNLNYPEEAKQQRLSGSLILDVAINPDGTVNNIELRHSSGYKLLDDAAIRIVKLAAPFAPFSAAMRKDTDILHITRTWQFLNDNSFSAGM